MVGVVYVALLWNIFKIKTNRKSLRRLHRRKNKTAVVISVEWEVNVRIMYLYDITNSFVEIKSSKTSAHTQDKRG